MTPRPHLLLAGRYRLHAPLGDGSLGEVWIAAHLSIRRWVAVHLLRGDVARDPHMRARVERAVMVPAELDDDGLCHVLDVDEDPIVGPFVVMELLDGASLDRILADRGVLSPAHAAWVVREAAAIVERMHARGVAHGNLSARQVFFERTDDQSRCASVRLLAPGLGRLDLATPGTTVLPFVPSPLAPEQVAGEAPSPASDVWALGAVLFEALIGHAPFARNTLVATLRAISEGTMPGLPPGAPVPIQSVILETLNRDPAARPSVRRLCETLEPFAAQIPRTWIDAYRLELGPAPGTSPELTTNGSARRNPPVRADSAADEGFCVDLSAERDDELGTAPTLLADRGTPEGS